MIFDYLRVAEYYKPHNGACFLLLPYYCNAESAIFAIFALPKNNYFCETLAQAKRKTYFCSAYHFGRRAEARQVARAFFMLAYLLPTFMSSAKYIRLRTPV